MGDANFLIEKRVVDGKTYTYLKELDNEATILEIMRLSGTVEKSDIALSNAKEVKKRAEQYKRS